MATTIQISDSVKQALDRMKIFERETYNEIIEEMIEDNFELNERTKKEVNERSKSNNFVSNEEVKKRFGL